MSADQTNRPVQAMCKAGLFTPLISIKLICIIVNLLEAGEDEALNQLGKEDYRNIQNETMARRMKEIKEGEEFIEMCEVLESYGNERYVEGDENRSRKVVLNLLKQNFSLTMISKSVERSVGEVESWAKCRSSKYLQLTNRIICR